MRVTVCALPNDYTPSLSKLSPRVLFPTVPLTIARHLTPVGANTIRPWRESTDASGSIAHTHTHTYRQAGSSKLLTWGKIITFSPLGESIDCAQLFAFSGLLKNCKWEQKRRREKEILLVCPVCPKDIPLAFYLLRCAFEAFICPASTEVWRRESSHQTALRWLSESSNKIKIPRKPYRVLIKSKIHRSARVRDLFRGFVSGDLLAESRSW